ncbi:hypothetical protein IGB42_04267 [Andreprevotia sp. IGB-42]|nr:hypothetical protein IGB42_04267 [Andreprevotia sp. IGB-42]
MVRCAVNATAGLRDEVAKRRRAGQRIRLPVQDEPDLVRQEFKRGVIADHMVQQQMQDPATIAHVIGGNGVQQRCPIQRHTVVAGVVTHIQLVRDFAIGGIKHHFVNAKRGTAYHDLYRLFRMLPEHGGAECIVTVDHGLECCGKAVEPGTGIKHELLFGQVGIATLIQQVMKQDAVLQCAQWIDVLDVGCAARYCQGNRGNARG